MKNAWACWLLLPLVITVPVAGATGQVELLRDPWGVPHLFAATEADGFFGLGYACAEDRILQMDLLRRLASGRLAEVYGADWVESDRRARIAGHASWAPRALETLPDEMRRWLRAYAAGVNSWIAADPVAFARRFAPTGYLPEPWTPADCILAARGLLALGDPFTDGPATAYRRFRELVDQVGESEALRRGEAPVDDTAAIVAQADMARDPEAYARLLSRPRTSSLRGIGDPADGPKMSHAWAVGGTRSTTGKPILESDPQLPLSSPPFFYEFHVAAGRIDARGLGLPGCPGLFIGYNRHLAWGASALGADSAVVFLDRLGRRPGTYQFRGQPEAFERRLERIGVREGPDVVQEVLTNRHGTVFNSLARVAQEGEALVAYDPQTLSGGSSVEAMLGFMSAATWAEFRAAMERYFDPGLHIVYADAEGRLRYQTLVHRPLTARPPHLAQEGWTGEQEITERIPLDELPHKANPVGGFISHANNMPVGSWYPHDLGIATGGTGHTNRSWRLEQLLGGDRLFSVEDFEAIVHRDDTNAVVAALLPVARRVVVEDGVQDEAVLELLASLEGWDGRETSIQRFPAAAGLRNTLTPYRGAGLNDRYGAGMGGAVSLAREIAARFEATGQTPPEAAVRQYLIRWLTAGATSGRGRASVAIPYQRCLPHSLPVVDPGLDIVSPPLPCPDTGTIWSQSGNLYTQIVDLAEIGMVAPGNSEDPRSPHRTSGIDIWVRGATRPAPLSREAVEALGCTATELATQAYEGPAAAGQRTVGEAPPGAIFIPAIPPVEPTRDAAGAQTPPGRKPDDPRLEAAFRVILRHGTRDGEVDAQLAHCREVVAAEPILLPQLRDASLLGIYLIEESAAGRLVVQYGSPRVRAKLAELLDELAEEPPRRAAGGPFSIVRSFPVSEATWAAKVGELFLVAADRSILVYRKTGPEPTDHVETNRVFPGVDGRIENCALADDLLYVPATAQGLLAYRIADLERPGVEPARRSTVERRIGAISVAGGRVYAAYPDGGLGVFDARTLALLGEGLGGIRLFGLTATAGGVVYASAVSDYAELLAIDARDPAAIAVATRVRNADYNTLVRFPASVAGTTLYVPESNGGVGVYDIGDPIRPFLLRRHAAVGASPPRGARARPGQVRALAVDGRTAFIVADRTVRAFRIGPDEWPEIGTIVESELSGNGLLDPQRVIVTEGVAAVPTTMEGVRFVDVSDPAAPKLLLTIDLPSRIEGLTKVGRMVYVTSDVDGVWQVDWEAEGGPRAARRIPLKGLSEDLSRRDHYVYVANGVGLATLDVSDEANPHLVHYWDFPYKAEPNIQEGWVEGVDLAGDTLFAAVGPAGLATFDVREPGSPRLLWLGPAGESPWGHDVSVSPSGTTLAFSGASRIVLLDVANAARPEVLADLPTPRDRGTQGSMFSSDGRWLVVCEAGTFSVFDVSEPRAPALAATHEGSGSESALFFGDYLLVSGRGSGLGVWRWDGDPTRLERVQTLPCFFYNSKFWVEGDRIFTNAAGVDELALAAIVR